ncbi:MAG: alpha/beta fold hydrolase [Thermodesulfobacteriota bacterium]
MPCASANGINLYYEIHGDGYPVILIGGLGSQIESWATQVPIYSKHFKVVVFDNRGAGRSDKPEGVYTTEGMADDTAALMDALGIETAHIVGKSMGGMIGQWLAIKYPEKVRKLVMGCSSASRDEVGNVILRMGREIASKVGMRAVWTMALYLGYTREYIEKNIGSLNSVVNAISESPEALRGYMGQSYAVEGHNTTELLHRIKAPALVMIGECDMTTSPRRTRELAGLIPGSKLKSFEGVGHGYWRERQEEADKLVLEFLLND